MFNNIKHEAVIDYAQAAHTTAQFNINYVLAKIDI